MLPELAADFTVISMDLPGHGRSAMIDRIPTVAALTDAISADLDAHGLDRVHVLGNSLGGRIAIELGRRGRTRSIVAISPSGMGATFERLHQATMMGVSRLINQVRGPWIDDLSRTPRGHSMPLAPGRRRGTPRSSRAQGSSSCPWPGTLHNPTVPAWWLNWSGTLQGNRDGRRPRSPRRTARPPASVTGRPFDANRLRALTSRHDSAPAHEPLTVRQCCRANGASRRTGPRVGSNRFPDIPGW